MKSLIKNSVVALLFFELLVIASINKISFCSGSTFVGCFESEREALLRFKHDLVDPSNRLASWSGDGDCCEWAGIVCNNLTGHVHELHLGNPFTVRDGLQAYMKSRFGGEVNPSLLVLRNLVYLDLSGNDFAEIQIPIFLGSIRNLRYLNLSGAGFSGMVPHQLGNLSHLQFLDLGSNHELYVDKLWWLSDLSSLECLDLSSVDLSKAFDWLQVTNALPSLEVLKLSICQLHHIPPLLPPANFSSLATLALYGNDFDNSLIPNWVFDLRHLVYLDLSDNNFQGPIPDGLHNMTSLTHLDLSGNKFNSSIPKWLYINSSLEYLSLGYNNLQGTLSSVLGNLTASIKSIDLSSNRLVGSEIPRSLGRHCNLRSISLRSVKLSQDISEILDILSSECVSDGLESLSLSGNELSGHLTDQIGQFRNLQILYLSNNSISGPIPSSIGQLSFLEQLDLSFNSISGPVPSSLGQLSTLTSLDLSYNKLNGTLSEIHFVNLKNLVSFDVSNNSLTLKVKPDWVPPFQISTLGLKACRVGPQFPTWLHSQKRLFWLDLSNSGISDTISSRLLQSLSYVTYLNLSCNKIYGGIPNLFEAINLDTLDLSSNNLSGLLPVITSSFLTSLDLSNNAFSGTISHFLCNEMNESRSVEILKLRGNLLHGHLPDCWMYWRNLSVLNLGINKFHGELPPSLGTLSSLKSLHLDNNSFSGTMAESLKNCTNLSTLDISENKFFGNVPTWTGERFSRLGILNLRSNMFNGSFPIELCHLASLHILDLAYNDLSGVIPTCIGNFIGMMTVNYSEGNYIAYRNNSIAISFEESVLMVKGEMLKYDMSLNLVRYIDLSKNNFSGNIPMELTKLKALQTLNLSHNSLSGRIPESIGAMSSLESIDFSKNQLSGEIPQSISSLTFLSHLNLSNNNLIGKIPSGTQLEGFDASSFVGNDLCGSPLPKKCTPSVPTLSTETMGGRDDDEDEVEWFYVSMALGFVVAFFTVTMSPCQCKADVYFHLKSFLGHRRPW